MWWTPSMTFPLRRWWMTRNCKGTSWPLMGVLLYQENHIFLLFTYTQSIWTSTAHCLKHTCSTFFYRCYSGTLTKARPWHLRPFSLPRSAICLPAEQLRYCKALRSDWAQICTHKSMWTFRHADSTWLMLSLTNPFTLACNRGTWVYHLYLSLTSFDSLCNYF